MTVYIVIHYDPLTRFIDGVHSTWDSEVAANIAKSRHAMAEGQPVTSYRVITRELNSHEND